MALRATEMTQTKEQHEVMRSKHPLGFGHPRDVAHAAAFLLAETGRWITGTTLIVDGGYSAA
jgi:NAD(P)-dependent dehydrogenase (short-subunit alcohol dehydrogenase family)